MYYLKICNNLFFFILILKGTKITLMADKSAPQKLKIPMRNVDAGQSKKYWFTKISTIGRCSFTSDYTLYFPDLTSKNIELDIFLIFRLDETTRVQFFTIQAAS